MKTETLTTALAEQFPTGIATLAQCSDLLTLLAQRGQFYHFDDDPHDVDCFTTEEADALQPLVHQMMVACDEVLGWDGPEPNGAFWEKFIMDVQGSCHVAWTPDGMSLHTFNGDSVVITPMELKAA